MLRKKSDSIDEIALQTLHTKVILIQQHPKQHTSTQPQPQPCQRERVCTQDISQPDQAPRVNCIYAPGTMALPSNEEQEEIDLEFLC